MHIGSPRDQNLEKDGFRKGFSGTFDKETGPGSRKERREPTHRVGTLVNRVVKTSNRNVKDELYT